MQDKIAPEDPTSAPVIIKAVFSKVNPIPAAAHPEYELSMEITTGMSAPPIGIINKKPIKKEIANNIQNRFDDCVEQSKNIVTTIDIKIIALSGCCPLNVIGEPDIMPCNLRNAIIDPEKVIAPTAAPIDISIKLPSLMFPRIPRLKASGFKKAEMATNTAASPTKL